MNSTVTISELQAQAARFVRRAEKRGAVTIIRRGKAVAFLVSRRRMEAIVETLEVVGNPKAMNAIHAYKSGKARFKDVSCLNKG